MNITEIVLIANAGLTLSYIALSILAALAPQDSKLGKWASKVALDLHNIKP